MYAVCMRPRCWYYVFSKIVQTPRGFAHAARRLAGYACLGSAYSGDRRTPSGAVLPAPAASVRAGIFAERAVLARLCAVEKCAGAVAAVRWLVREEEIIGRMRAGSGRFRSGAGTESLPEMTGSVHATGAGRYIPRSRSADFAARSVGFSAADSRSGPCERRRPRPSPCLFPPVSRPVRPFATSCAHDFPSRLRSVSGSV